MADEGGIQQTAPEQSSASTSVRAVIILIAAYVVLVAFSLWTSYNFTNWGKPESLRDFAGLVAVGLTASSAMMGLVVSIFTLRKNQEAAASLELFKSGLVGNLERLKSDLQRDVEVLKSDLQTKVYSQKVWSDLRFEHEKMKTTAEASAYAKLWTSIDSAYLSLAKLETGIWATQDRIQMDSSLLEARAQLIYVREPEHQTLWERARQRARDISERAAKIDAMQQHKLWQDNVGEFASFCTQFKQIANTEIHRAPPTHPSTPA
jgi:hypothetical protein